ncbi:MAG: antibiotic biosynthesis monooxygenase [Candidatus Eremiobacteraeota bacterium]|nr:antibiotic biosynthesis monooxygenase [Candidatus Eremiobacteraeota bacterium]
MFVVIVRFSFRTDAFETAREAMRELAPLMRAEDGMLRFDALVSDDDGVLAFDELWRDSEAWQRHVANRPAAIATLARTIAGGFAEPPEVRTYTLLA